MLVLDGVRADLPPEHIREKISCILPFEDVSKWLIRDGIMHVPYGISPLLRKYYNKLGSKLPPNKRFVVEE